MRKRIRNWIEDHWTRQRVYECTDMGSRRLVRRVRGRLEACAMIADLDGSLEGQKRSHWHIYVSEQVEERYRMLGSVIGQK